LLVLGALIVITFVRPAQPRAERAEVALDEAA
jgi:hypothetical protein